MLKKNRSSCTYSKTNFRHEQLEARRLLASDIASSIGEAPTSWFAEVDVSLRPSLDWRAEAAIERESNIVGPKRLVASEWIVQLKDGVVADLASVQDSAPLFDSSVTDLDVLSGLGQPGLVLVRGYGFSVDGVRDSLASLPSVDSYSINGTVSGSLLANDPEFSNMTNLHNVGQFGAIAGADIEIEEAWDITTGSSSVVVGVIDSGIDPTHQDLYLNIWINQGEIRDQQYGSLVDVDADGLFTFYDLNDPSNASLVRDLNLNGYIDAHDLLDDPLWADGLDTDGNGFVDDFFGWNFRTDSAEAFAPNNPSDVLGHGTHIAGTIGAIGDNGVGITGINWLTSLMSLKFLDANNQGDTASAIAAINYATMMRSEFNTNVRVLNNSWGQAGGFSTNLRNAIQASGDAGIAFVAAAGNGNVLGQGVDNDLTPFFPASYDLPNVISVAATDSRDQLASFSNFGVSSVDVAAPGVSIVSTLPGDRYGAANGTSMATPHVSATLAMLAHELPNASLSEAKRALVESATPEDRLPRIASGRISAHKTLATTSIPPGASVDAIQPLTETGDVPIEFVITWSDVVGINTDTLGIDDVVIERLWGPAERYSASVLPESIVRLEGGKVVEASYAVMPIGGAWDATDYGRYQIRTLPGGVEAVDGRMVEERILGEFQVRIDSENIHYVTSTNDDGADGTLRAAIIAANAAANVPQTIILESAHHTLQQEHVPDPNSAFPFPSPFTGATSTDQNLTGWSNASAGDLDVQASITILGDRRTSTIVDAAGIDRVFKVHPGARLHLERLTVTGGISPGDQGGGGILNAGEELFLHDVLVKDNLSLTGIEGTGGGAIATWYGHTIVEKSEITDNFAYGGGGLFVANDATAQVTQSAFVGNTSTFGGAIASVKGGEVQVESSTFSGNSGNAIDVAMGASLRNAAGVTADVTAVSADGKYALYSGNIANYQTGEVSSAPEVFLVDLTNESVEQISVTSEDELPSVEFGASFGENGSMSPDGRFVVFWSYADFGFGSNGEGQIYIRDRQAGTTELVSISTDGGLQNGSSSAAQVSDDGQIVIFESTASDLISDDSSYSRDLFYHNRRTGETIRISQDRDGNSLNSWNGYEASLSGDGSTVVFTASGGNIAPDNPADIYATHLYSYSIEQGTYNWISQPRPNFEIASASSPSLSANGQYIAYHTYGNLFGEYMSMVWAYDASNKTHELVAVNDDGDVANAGGGYDPFSSPNGRFIAFKSLADNLDPRDQNHPNQYGQGGTDIFVRDRVSGTTLLATITEDGFQSSDRFSKVLSVSDDGGVTFVTRETSFLYGKNDGPGLVSELGTFAFRTDPISSELRSISLPFASAPINLDHVTISDNAGYGIIGPAAIRSSVVFGNTFGSADEQRNIGRGVFSYGHNVFSGSGPRYEFSFRGRYTDISVDADASVLEPMRRIGDGLPFHELSYASEALNVAESPGSSIDQRGTRRSFRADSGAVEMDFGSASGIVFVDLNRNGIADENERGIGGVSVRLEGLDSTISVASRVSPDRADVGRFSVDPIDAGQYKVSPQIPDGWEVTTSTEGVYELVGSPDPSEDIRWPQVSRDGRYLVAQTKSSNLSAEGFRLYWDVYRFDRQAQSFERLTEFDDVASGDKKGFLGNNLRPSISADGSLVAFDSRTFNQGEAPGGDHTQNVYVMGEDGSLVGGAHLTRDISGFDAFASLSADGRSLVYHSTNTHPVGTDTNGTLDVFFNDLTMPFSADAELISVASNGQSANGLSVQPDVSGDGRYVVFRSRATNLAESDTDTLMDIYLYDRQTQEMTHISRGIDGESNGDSFPPFITPDGRYVVFESSASNLVPGDENGFNDTFLWDRETGGISKITQAADGSGVNGHSGLPSISDDGRYVSYTSWATNIVDFDDTNYTSDVFLWDRLSGQTRLISQNRNGEIGNDQSWRSTISGDGSQVFFESLAFNFVEGDRDFAWDIYAYRNSDAPYVIAGAQQLNLSIGIAPIPGTISGAVFQDVIQNSVLDNGEPMFENWSVFLDHNDNGRLDEDEPFTVTDAAGQFEFADLESEQEYKVVVNWDSEWELVTQSNSEPGSWNVFLPAGGHVTSRNFGFRETDLDGQSANGSITGSVYTDLNSDAIQQSNEPSHAGVTVYLDLDGDGARDFDEPRTITDQNGTYQFTSLATRNYEVRPLLDELTEQTAPISADFSLRSKQVLTASSELGNPQDLIAADFDGDGYTDAAIAMFSGNRIIVSLNDTTGRINTSSVETSIAPNGNGPVALAAADFDRDGRLDLVSANQLNGTVTVLSSFDTAGFAKQDTYSAGPSPTDVAAADLNADGLPDVIIANSSSNQLRVLLSTGSGFSAPIVMPSAGLSPRSILVTDLNGDTVPDLAVTNFGDVRSSGDFGNVAIHFGNGDGTFSTGVTYRGGAGPIDLASADVDGDGHADIVVANFLTNSASVLIGNGDGTFTTQNQQLNVGQGPLEIELVDIDSDMDADILVTNLVSQSVSVIRNRLSQGNADFEPASSFGVAQFSTSPGLRMEAVDLDKSGTADLLLTNSLSSELSVYSNTLVDGSHLVGISGSNQAFGRDFAITPASLQPRLDVIPDATGILEDSVPQEFLLTGISPGRRNGIPLRLSAIPSDSRLISQTQIAYAGFADTAKLTVELVPNQFGRAHVSVVLQDAGADELFNTPDDTFAQREFAVDVLPVNDAPEFSMPSNRRLSFLEDSGVHTVEGFISDISAGKFEDDQVLGGFGVFAEDQSLFAVQPAIDSEGNLSFELADNQSGSTSILVRLNDNGGNVHGGQSSRTEVFVLEVVGVDPQPHLTSTVGRSTFHREFDVLIDFDEPVSELEAEDISVQNGNVARLEKINEQSYIAGLVADADGIVAISLPAGKAIDQAGNPNNPSNLVLVAVDTGDAVFQPLLSTQESRITGNEQFTAFLDFGREVTGLGLEDLRLENATGVLAELETGRYSVEMTAVAEGPVSVGLLPGTVLDLDGRTNSASSPLNLDYIDVSGSDFGDAPDRSLTGFVGSYPTLLIDDGARHKTSELYLGQAVTQEREGAISDLDDGVFFAISPIVNAFTDSTSSVVVLSSGSGELDGWIDFNRDGDWNDAGEQIFASVPVTAGENTRPYTIPAGSSLGETYARFRLSTAGGLAATGPAPDGEVEDYALQLLPATSSSTLIIDGQQLGSHSIRFDGNQLLVTHGEHVVAAASTVGAVEITRGDGLPASRMQNPTTFTEGWLAYNADSHSTSVMVDSSLNLSDYPSDFFAGIDSIDLTASGSQRLQLAPEDVLRQGTGGRVQVLMDALDELHSPLSWGRSAPHELSGRQVQRHIQGDAELTIVSPTPWHNHVQRTDINGDGQTSPIDVLLLVNALNREGEDQNHPAPTNLYDVNRDNALSPIDVLLIVNKLNRKAEGEHHGAHNQLGSESDHALVALFGAEDVR